MLNRWSVVAFAGLIAGDRGAIASRPAFALLQIRGRAIFVDIARAGFDARRIVAFAARLSSGFANRFTRRLDSVDIRGRYHILTCGLRAGPALRVFVRPAAAPFATNSFT